MTEFAKEPVWKQRWGFMPECLRTVRFTHHDGSSYLLSEREWYLRLSMIEFEKRGGLLSSRDEVIVLPHGGETEEKIQLRLERIEPVTREQARKEGWKG